MFRLISIVPSSLSRARLPSPSTQYYPVLPSATQCYPVPSVPRRDNAWPMCGPGGGNEPWPLLKWLNCPLTRYGATLHTAIVSLSRTLGLQSRKLHSNLCGVTCEYKISTQHTTSYVFCLFAHSAGSSGCFSDKMSHCGNFSNIISVSHNISSIYIT